MRDMNDHRHSVFGIVPPYILDAISKNGTPDERDIALQTLDRDLAIRSARPTFIEAPPPSRGLQNKRREVYNANHGTGLPGTLVRTEGQGPSGDVEVDEAYDGLGATFDLYWNAYNRNSVDDAGMTLIASVHYDQDYNNAEWNGQQMLFGDGDGQIFNRFTIAIDIIGHELTHGVTAYTAHLEYHDQPGALNESISDVFGSLVKQYAATPQQTADQADWLIGAGIFTSRIHGTALRSMKAPGTAFNDPLIGKDPQPAHMSNYDNTTDDNGGVHTNSGIPNHAFYLVATALGGYAWEKAGRIWYETLRDPHLTPTAQFQDFANLTAANASRLFGDAAGQAVANAWQQVGINVATGTHRTPQVGGGGGQPFADDLTGVKRLTKLTIRHGAYVDAIQCTWQMNDGSSHTGAQHGGAGGRQDVITFAADEYIVGVSGRAGAYVDQLVIKTNKRTYGPYGGNGGKPFDLGPLAAHTTGFFGRSGRYLDALGAISVS